MFAHPHIDFAFERINIFYSFIYSSREREIMKSRVKSPQLIPYKKTLSNQQFL